MTYLHEYKILDDLVQVEYTFSSVTDSIKVVDMWIDGKEHKINWMSHEGRDKLMARLEDDFTNRMCGTNDDEPYDHSLDIVDPDESDIPGPNPETYGYNDSVSTDLDLDRDMPGFEGTMGALEDLVDNHIGEPEFLGGR